MARPLKIIAWILAALVALVVIAAVIFSLVFDPNDYKDRISQGVRDATGRELVIEGDLDVSFFPWFAIEVGRSELGNAEGFGAAPFASFDSARLSVRVMPLLLRREVVVGTASLDSLSVNLQVRADGRNNWDDLAESGTAEAEVETESAGASTGAIDIASVSITNAALSYSDASTGDRIEITDLALQSGRVAAGEPVPLDGGLTFSLEPAGILGRIDLGLVISFDTDAATVTISEFELDGLVEGVADVPATIRMIAPAIAVRTEAQSADVGEIELQLMSVNLRADVEPFSYAGDPQPTARIDVASFSPRTLMNELGIEAPETADPDVLDRLRMTGTAKVGAKAIALNDLTLVIDDTTFKGRLSVPRDAAGFYELDLAGDQIDLARYMAPATEEAAAAEGADATVEIPVELIRAFNARGNLTIANAALGNIPFENVALGLNSVDGLMRIHPISADFFDGGYRGDVRIDATGNVPSIAVNETIRDVNLAPMARAMFELENITGTINGTFQLGGRGADMDAIRRDLDGSLSIELIDGAWEGTDVWYEMRRARAFFKGLPEPEAPSPLRTRFSTMKASGVVTDGVMQNDDFFAELPFMQVTGRGKVNFVEASVDYSVTGRVLERPEFVSGVSEEELKDFTKAVIPFRITGSLASPAIRPDVEAMLKGRAKDEAKKLIVDKLLGGDEEPPADGEQAEGEPAEGEEEAEEKDVEDQLKDEARKRLRDLLGD